LASKRKEATTRVGRAPDLLPFQQFFLRFCRERGWSYRRAAEQIGDIAGPNVWAWAQGLSTPDETRQERLAKLAGVAVEDVARLVWEQKRRRREALARTRGALPGVLAEGEPESGNAWARVEALIGAVEGPKDWAAEHDHYLYGLPKRRRPPRR